MRTISVKTLLMRWPSRAAVLEDALEGSPELELVAVHRWIQRNAIPPKYWALLLKGAKQRGIELTAEELVIAHAISAGDTTQTDRGAA